MADKSRASRIYRKSNLTPAKKKFAEVYAKTDNATEAVRQAYKEVNLTPGTQRYKGSKLLTNPSVQQEIQLQRIKLEELSSKAIGKISDLLNSEDEKIRTVNVWKTIEQVHGKNSALEGNIGSITINIAPPQEYKTIDIVDSQ